jgi:polysaccharide biosynthesis protein PslG
VRTRLALSAAAGLIVLAGCGGSTRVEVGPPIPRDFFGMNAQVLQQVAASGNLVYTQRNAAQIARLGVGFVRSSFDWTQIEPSPPVAGQHTYRFAPLDGWVGTLASQHLRWLPTVKGGPIPEWAASPSAPPECGTNSPPDGTVNYAALMDALARRYGRGGSFWHEHPEVPYEPVTEYEVWNEPNFGRLWCPKPEPAAYARLYLAARDAVHAVDPKAVVLIGGLAAFTTNEPGPPAKTSYRTFLSTAVDAVPALDRAVDAVAVHPYGKDPAAVLQALRGFREALDASGLSDAPMTADEVGWHTRGALGLPPVPEEKRAEDFRIVTPAIARSDCDVIGIAAHTWVTPERRPSYPEDWYGLADPRTGEPYPSAVSYGDQVRRLEGGEPVSPVTRAACATTGQGGTRDGE